MTPPQVWHWLLLAVAALTVAAMMYRLKRYPGNAWFPFLFCLILFAVSSYFFLKRLAEPEWWKASALGMLGAAMIAASIVAERIKPR